MAVLRKVKKSNYTTIDNNIFKNKELSLKAKGMICTMLSLPDDWEFSESGLTELSDDSRTSIRSALKELMEKGYLVRKQLKEESGKFGKMEYIIYEEPLYQKPLLQNPISVNEHNKILNNKVLNNKYIKYGTYGRVKLKQDEYTRLVDEFGKDFINHQIELLDEYIESNNNKNKYTNFNLVLRKSIRENWFNKPNKVVYETI